MNLSTILIGLVLLALFVLAIRFLVRNGACAACAEKGACHAAPGGPGQGVAAGCAGNCAACPFSCPSKEKPVARMP